MESHEKYKSTIGFIDILFNILVGFAFLFIVAFLLIKPEAKREDFDRKAEFVIVMEWDNKRHDDIDLYVQDPSGKIAHFRHRVVNFMHLDKDDLGKRNDAIMVNGVEQHVDINREVITIRGILPGEYIVNAHYYSDYSHQILAEGALDVKVIVHKVNPYSIIWEGIETLKQKGSEETFVRFTIEKDGTVKSSSIRQLDKRMVSPNVGEHHSAPRPEYGESAYENMSPETFIGSGDEDGDVQDIPEGQNLDDAAGGF